MNDGELEACSSRDHLLSHWDHDLLDFTVFNHSSGFQ